MDIELIFEGPPSPVDDDPLITHFSVDWPQPPRIGETVNLRMDNRFGQFRVSDVKWCLGDAENPGYAPSLRFVLVTLELLGPMDFVKVRRRDKTNVLNLADWRGNRA